ncbi:hypothetical protein [Salmonella phage AR2819]|nr:hypothetical protein [Salmonella phage AR2819]
MNKVYFFNNWRILLIVVRTNNNLKRRKYIMAIEIIAQSKSGKTVMYGTEEGRCIINYGTITGESPEKGGRYLVEYGSRLLMVSKVDGREIMIPRKEYFDSRSAAMTFFLFQKRHELFVEAKDAGLDDATAELIAEGKMTLEAALGGHGLRSRSTLY